MSPSPSSNPGPLSRRACRLAVAVAALLVPVLPLGLAGAAPLTQGVAAPAGSALPGHGDGAVPVKGDLSMDEAIDRAQKRFRARVVRAEQIEQGGRVVYVLRLLSDEDGRVFTVRVDARSGAMQ